MDFSLGTELKLLCRIIYFGFKMCIVSKRFVKLFTYLFSSYNCTVPNCFKLSKIIEKVPSFDLQGCNQMGIVGTYLLNYLSHVQGKRNQEDEVN